MKKKTTVILVLCFAIILSVMTVQASPLNVNPFVDADGIVDSADVIELRKQLVGLSESKPVDVNEDNRKDVCDLVALLNYLDSFGDNDLQDTWN